MQSSQPPATQQVLSRLRGEKAETVRPGPGPSGAKSRLCPPKRLSGEGLEPPSPGSLPDGRIQSLRMPGAAAGIVPDILVLALGRQQCGPGSCHQLAPEAGPSTVLAVLCLPRSQPGAFSTPLCPSRLSPVDCITWAPCRLDSCRLDSWWGLADQRHQREAGRQKRREVGSFSSAPARTSTAVPSTLTPPAPL